MAELAEDYNENYEEGLRSGNIEYGFDDMNKWEKQNPGNKEFCCDYCGIYTASRARCNKCEEY